MSDSVILRTVDWPLLTRFRQAAEQGSDELHDALAAAQPYRADVENDPVAGAEPSGDIEWARAYRRDPATTAADFAAWLSAIDANRRDDTLMAASFSSGTSELPVPDYMVLAWFSELYLPVALGIPGSKSSLGAPYDGPTVLPEVMASDFRPGDLSFALHDAGATKIFADALRHILVSDGGRGPIGLLYDFDENFGSNDFSLIEGIDLAIDLLSMVYKNAANEGHGVLVLNG